MTPVQRRNAYVFGTVCSVLTLGLLAWPVRPTQEPAPRVPIGGEIDGWRVIAITGRAVTVNRPGNQQKLQLFNVDKQMPSVGSPDSPPETAG